MQTVLMLKQFPQETVAALKQKWEQRFALFLSSQHKAPCIVKAYQWDYTDFMKHMFSTFTVLTQYDDHIMLYICRQQDA